MGQDNQIVIHVSAKVKKKPTAGHDYWLHWNLTQAAIARGINWNVVGPGNQESHWIEGLLYGGKKYRTLQILFPGLRVRRDAKAISKKFTTDSPTLVHIYEGGFRELLLLKELNSLRPSWTYVFNFNLLDPWVTLLRGLRIGARTIRQIAGSIGEAAVFFAETDNLCGLLDSETDLETKPYPLFGIAKKTGLIAQKKYDYTFFVNGDKEVQLSLGAIREFEARHSNAPGYYCLVPRWGSSVSITSLGSLAERVDIVNTNLSDFEYETLMCSTKVSVLPYLDSYYVYGSSGRLLDSRTFGLPVIAPRFTAVGRQAEEMGWGPTFIQNEMQLAEAMDVSREWSVENTRNALTPGETVDLILANVSQTTRAQASKPRRGFRLLSLGIGLVVWSKPRLVAGNLLALLKSR